MTRAGLPVPPGFALLTTGYRAFVSANGLQPEIERLAATARPDDAASVEEVSSQIRALFDRGAMPPEIAAAVTEAYAQLGDAPAVAVRSSATAEDLPGASFAGQQETYLNIRGAEAVLAAVQRCWSSLWTPRAISYRARQGIGPESVALAVVVQRLVTADVAGILFTANPVNGRRDQMVIDGAWGLGEAVVSGQVTPDHWVADAASGAIVEERIARKEWMTLRHDGGTVTSPVPAHQQEQPVLDAAGVDALTALGRQVEAHYGSPQDIEWALADGRWYLVQSRPITSLFPLPEPRPAPGAGLRAYYSMQSLQGLVEPFTPAGISCFRSLAVGFGRMIGYAYGPGDKPPAFTTTALRIYIDVTETVRNPRFRKVVLTIPGVADKLMVELMADLAEREPALSPVKGRQRLRFNFRVASRIVPRLLRTLFFPELARRRMQEDTDRLVADLEERGAALKGVDERIRFLQVEPVGFVPAFLPNVAPVVFPGVISRFAAENLLQRWLGDASGLQPVLRSLKHNPTTEMDLALWKLSRTLKAAGVQPSAEHPAVREFLDAYGHRAVREIDIGMPRWRDDPEHVLGVLRNYLTHDEQDDPVAHFERGLAEAEAAAEALVGRVRREKGLLRAGVLRFLLRRFRVLGGTREYPKFVVVRMMAAFRRVWAGAGEELVAAGRLDNPDDIFFLGYDDVAAGGDLRALAAANRAEYQRELGRRTIPRVMTSLGETLYTPPVTIAGALSGMAVSPGVHEGVVRVIHDPRGAVLQKGEVLVTPGTDPAWTPLFLTAGALVMETGGIMSHGSVVAREYGIPAVVAVTEATTRLKTGQRVKVDGESGVVIPLD